MRGISFVVAAIAAVNVSAEDSNEADNAYIVSGGYMPSVYGQPLYEPYGAGYVDPGMRYVVQ